MLCSLANLAPNQLESLQSLEKSTGKVLLAYACHQAKPASLNPDELKRLQTLENEMGVALVAVE
jgi:hypothetical protein